MVSRTLGVAGLREHSLKKRRTIRQWASNPAGEPTFPGYTSSSVTSPAFSWMNASRSSGRRPMPDGTRPVPGGWNRLHLQVNDLAGEVERLRAAGCSFRNDIITGPGGSQILLEDPSGNPVELFQPAR